MNVICIGTLDKFSRFYLNIKQHLDSKTKGDVNLKIYSIHISGFLYTLFRLKFSAWISLKAWRLAKRKKHFYSQIILENDIYKGVDYNKHIAFHQNLNKTISTKALQMQALAYIDIFDAIYKKDKPDYLITIGDSRLSIEIAVALAKLHNITKYFIEQGPFGTTFFDDIGVNANVSIRNNIKNIKGTSTNIETKLNSKKYSRSPLYRGLDIVLMTLFEKTKFYPPDLKYTDLNSYKSKKTVSKLKRTSIDSNQSIILLILQVPLDVNMISHSPIFSSHTEILTNVHANLPKGVKLIVREHPLFINKYAPSLYNFIEKHNIIIESSLPLAKALELSNVVVVNNSTVGIEAILNYKSVVVLGNAFYDNDDICIKLKSKDKLDIAIEYALNNTPNKELIDNFKNVLFSSVLLKGSITDATLISSKYIANHLLAQD